MIKHAYILPSCDKLIYYIEIGFFGKCKMLKILAIENALFQTFSKRPDKVCPCNMDSITFCVHSGKENPT